MIHNKPAATHSNGAFGITSSASVASTAPMRKYGRRRPSRHQVRSDQWPINGWTMRPVSGAAIHSAGIASTPAPRVWKIRLTLAFCSAKPNWIPRNPKHMFQICQNDSAGLRIIVSPAGIFPTTRLRIAQVVVSFRRKPESDLHPDHPTGIKMDPGVRRDDSGENPLVSLG